jgi:lipopolysaccharide transport system ATP-binding protein
MIHVEGIGKRYRLGQTVRHDTLREAIMDRVRFGRRSRSTDERRVKQDFWALKNVSFDVAEGEVIGIIGKNGSGKSTLLKILSRITPPTEGRVRLRGRVASLLEVGTGFHPDLSGRENIYLNGAILGMQRQEIKSRFDEIVAFAEVEQFLDTPVKRYSSGMYVRLAFAVAAHLDPQILIVDEVLSVGDAEFQKKCLGKMGEVAKGGRTVLFVSHNMAAVQILTTRAVLLSGGRMIESAETEKVVSTYLKRSTGGVSARDIKSSDPDFSVYEFEFDGETVKPGFNAPFRFDISFDLEKDYRPIIIVIEIMNSVGSRLVTSRAVVEMISRGKSHLSLQISDHHLPPGDYSVTLKIAWNGQALVHEEGALAFEVNSVGVTEPLLIPLMVLRDRIGAFIPMKVSERVD